MLIVFIIFIIRIKYKWLILLKLILCSCISSVDLLNSVNTQETSLKFLKAEPFEKHIGDSLPDHPSSLYLLIMPDPFERNFLAKRIMSALDFERHTLDVETLLDEIESPSLFSKKRILICDEIEKLKAKKLLLPDDLVLILMGKAEPNFFDAIKKEAVTLDLSKEKPWERKSRVQRWLLESAQARGKTLATDAAAHLLELGHADFASLLQELEKAALYAGNEKQISLEMVKAVGTLSPIQTGWQLSEALVWGGTLNRRSMRELCDLYSIVGQIRYQLNLGITLASGREAPKLPPKRREKLQSLATSLRTSYFAEGLKDLFELELKMRSGITNQLLLLDHFHAKLRGRSYGSLSSS
ncbi:MAG: hypothetical protein K1060chlam2_00879 [Chlamydiae bacterium]|nr:hypothetical protein [Chlamydiota bacterium]